MQRLQSSTEYTRRTHRPRRNQRLWAWKRNRWKCKHLLFRWFRDPRSKATGTELAVQQLLGSAEWFGRVLCCAVRRATVQQVGAPKTHCYVAEWLEQTTFGRPWSLSQLPGTYKPTKLQWAASRAGFRSVHTARPNRAPINLGAARSEK